MNFLGRCVLPGRAFTRRLYACLGGKMTGKTTRLKLHHHLRISREIREDLKVWNIFLGHPPVFCRGFMDFGKTWLASEINFFSDASKNRHLGMGAVCKKSWMSICWPDGYIDEYDPSIEYLELFAVMAAVVQWIHR